MASKPSEYSEGSIRVLKGLEPVKQRPGMYTRTDNPLHILQEVLDNAADEALAGHGKRIRVILHGDGSVSVEDDGRGIPFGLHPEEKAPVIELVFTRLHAGGKFDKGKGGAYSFSGGLHGVGVSVTNALAKRLEATSYRDGEAATIVFAGGDVEEKLKRRKSGADDRKQGTTVRVWPDPKYFDSTAVPMNELAHLLRSKAVLMPGVTVQLVDEKKKDTQTWQYRCRSREGLDWRDGVRLVSSCGRPALELWLNRHVEHGKKLAELAIRAAQSRQKAGQKVEKRKGSGVAVLPGKLPDCESKDLSHNEVFLVEGDSAGGSAKMGRDKEMQAVLPLRGKVLNTWEVERDRLFANNEIHDIAVAIGVDPHGV